MNEVTFIEHIDSNTSKVITINETKFLSKLEEFCYNKFTQDNDIKTFAFILNNNTNNYFAELLSNTSFIEEFNGIIKDKLTAIWCEPEKQTTKDDNKSYEYFVQAKGLDSKKIWDNLSTKLNSESKDHILSNSSFPIILLIKVSKSINGVEPEYKIEDAILHQIKDLSFFDNIIDFKNGLIELFQTIVTTLKLNESSVFTENFPEYMTEVKKSIIREVTRTVFDKLREIDLSHLFSNFRDLIVSLIDEIDITNLL